MLTIEKIIKGEYESAKIRFGKSDPGAFLLETGAASSDWTQEPDSLYCSVHNFKLNFMPEYLTKLVEMHLD